MAAPVRIFRAGAIFEVKEMCGHCEIKLNPRLAAAASMVRPGKVTADVGTDHAYLPVYLVTSGRCPKCVAGDIGAGPLNNARETVALYGLPDQITLVLSDGLEMRRSERRMILSSLEWVVR